MKYAGYMPNDFINGEGVCVSFWTQGCPHHCEGCHNKETWSFDGGEELPCNIGYDILNAISANGFQRNFSILGGEPMCPENIPIVEFLVDIVKQTYPNIKIFLWTGYTLDELKSKNDETINFILDNIDVLIDGKFDINKRDITLNLRGSSNQNILYKNKDF